jgi:hypothetical protein
LTAAVSAWNWPNADHAFDEINIRPDEMTNFAFPHPCMESDKDRRFMYAVGFGQKFFYFILLQGTRRFFDGLKPLNTAYGVFANIQEL